MSASVLRSTVANLIKSRILLSGPIPVADYMRFALTTQPIGNDLTRKDNSSSGYYMKNDVFGQRGDFITSPEISQLFGELLAVWGLQTWMEVGGPEKFSIVEFGPGRGTLAKDILRVFKQFESICGKNVSLHLVEISPFLASVQCASLTQTREDKLGESEKTSENCTEQMQRLDPLKESSSGPFYHHAVEGCTGFPIYWYRSIRDLPQHFHWFIAHEFFDALPCHKLQKVGNEWREVLVDVNPEKEDFRFVLSRNETPVIKLLQEKHPSLLQDSRQHIEVSVEELGILDNLTTRLDSYGGFATIIDYGHDGTKEDTFRAFHKHKLHDPLVDPGKADLTVDVDFSTIKKLFNNRALICGPTSQAEFFSRIGIEHRLQMLVNKCKTEDERKNLISGCNMIINEMGTRFNVMTLLPKILKTCMPDLRIAGHN